jgi:hypothetical protein
MSLQRLDVTVAPVAEPVGLADVKDHLRITWTNEDAWLTNAIKAARRWLEPRAGRALVTQTLRAVFAMDLARAPHGRLSSTLGREPYRIGRELTFHLPHAVGVVSVATVEIESDLNSWTALTGSTDYVVDSASEPVAVYLRSSALANWMPSGALSTFVGVTLPRVRVTYTAGYGATPADVPEDWRQAILAAVAWLYENRATGASVPPGSLLDGLDIVSHY